MSDAHASPLTLAHVVRTPVFWGLVVGVGNALAPIGVWWLDIATVHAIASSVMP